jgi:predicted NBD/HSP70 family sugar kinase
MVQVLGRIIASLFDKFGLVLERAAALLTPETSYIGGGSMHRPSCLRPLLALQLPFHVARDLIHVRRLG